MVYGVKMGASDPREAYVYASQSLRCAKTSLVKVCIPSTIELLNIISCDLTNVLISD